MTRAQRPSRTHLLGEVSKRQHGVFTRQQAIDVGFSIGAISRRLTAGAWERADWCVYRDAHTPGSWEQRLLAACLGGPAVASHRSAALLWNLAGSERSVVEVTALRHRRRRSAEVVWHESQILFDADLTEIDRIPTTTPTRTLIDLSVVLERKDLEIALDDAIRRGLSSLTQIRSLIERMGTHRPGSPGMLRLLEGRTIDDVTPQSRLETRFVQLVRDARLAEPQRQYTVRIGNRNARADFAYPEQRLAIEIDGFEHHGGRQAWEADLARQNRLVERGWHVLRFTSTDLERRPAEVVRQLDAFMTRAERAS